MRNSAKKQCHVSRFLTITVLLFALLAPTFLMASCTTPVPPAPPATEPTTDPVSDPATEPVTVPNTDPVTDPVTDPITEPATDPATEPVTEPATDPVTEPVVTPVASDVVFATQNGKGTMDGLTPNNATKLANALGIVKKSGGTIVICDAVTLEASADSKYFFPSNESAVTITSVYNGVDYRSTANASVSLVGNVYFYGDYIFENINLISTKDDIILCFQYNNITIGENVKCTRGSGVKTDMSIVAGYNVISSAYMDAYEASCHEDCEITVKSGNWKYVRGGNTRAQTNSVFGTIDKGVTLLIRIMGGTFTANSGNVFTSALGMNSIDGTVFMEISGGTFKGNVFAISRCGSMDNYAAPYIDGQVTLKFTGGEFTSTTLKVFQDANSKPDFYNNGKVSIVIENGNFRATRVTATGTGDKYSEIVVADSLKSKFSFKQFKSSQTSTALCASYTAPTLQYNKVSYDAPPALDTTPELGKRPEKLTSADKSKLTNEAKEKLSKVVSLYNKGNGEKYTGLRVLNDPQGKYSLKSVASAKLVTLLTGEYSINKTITNYGIGGAGGGYMIDCGDYVLVAFGDTEEEGKIAGPWRSNTLGFTTDFDFTDGIVLDGFYMNSEESGKFAGIASEFLLSSHTDLVEKSKIPTGGVMVNGTLYFYYMSVKNWSKDDTGIWTCNYGGLAKSTDMGRSWETPSDLRWPAEIGTPEKYDGKDENGKAIVAEHPLYGFAQLYPVYDEANGYVYVFGVPGGRCGAIKLMRVKAENIENFNEYEYLVGRDANGKGIFEKGYDAMMKEYACIEAPAGGVGVMYNEYLGEWVIAYCTPGQGSDLPYDNAHEVNGIYMRVAKTLDGEWSAPTLIMSQFSYGQVYEPRICAKYQDGSKMMLICSRWDVYNSLIFEIDLAKK